MVPPRCIFQVIFVIAGINGPDHIPLFAASTNLLV
jgi:hypothetical protein